MANLNQTKWADHLRGCAGLANEIAGNLDIRDDGARQAMFATIVIDAGKHNVFLEPIPEDAAVMDDSPRPTQMSPAQVKQERDDLPAANRGALQNPTPAQSESANRTALLSGINSARDLLKWTPVQMNQYIKDKLKTEKGLGSLDLDELGQLTEKLSKRIDAEKKKPESPLKEHLTNREKEKLHDTNEALEDWP